MAIRAYEAKEQQWPERNLLPVAMAYYIARDYEKACPIFQRVLAKEPANLCAKLGCGASLTGLGRYQEAEPLLEQVWKKTQKIEALVKLAVCYHGLADKRAFADIIPDLLTHKYDDLDGTLSTLCNYALLEPDEKRAREILEKALADVPDGYIADHADLVIEVQAALKRFHLEARGRSLDKAVAAQADE